MIFHEQALNTVEIVAKHLDPLVKSYGFDIKLRSSDPSIFSETLGYEKGPYEIQIVACMHPHDYPNSLSVRFIEKIPGDWRYATIEQLLKQSSRGQEMIGYAYPIWSENEAELSAKHLTDELTIILSEGLYQSIPQSTITVNVIESTAMGQKPNSNFFKLLWMMFRRK